MSELNRLTRNIINQCGKTTRQLTATDEENITILIAEYSIGCELDSQLRKDRDSFLKKVYSVQE